MIHGFLTVWGVFFYSFPLYCSRANCICVQIHLYHDPAGWVQFGVLGFSAVPCWNVAAWEELAWAHGCPRLAWLCPGLSGVSSILYAHTPQVAGPWPPHGPGGTHAGGSVHSQNDGPEEAPQAGPGSKLRAVWAGNSRVSGALAHRDLSVLLPQCSAHLVFLLHS